MMSSNTSPHLVESREQSARLVLNFRNISIFGAGICMAPSGVGAPRGSSWHQEEAAGSARGGLRAWHGGGIHAGGVFEGSGWLLAQAAMGRELSEHGLSALLNRTCGRGELGTGDA